jgi:hypothetical protein
MAATQKRDRDPQAGLVDPLGVELGVRVVEPGVDRDAEGREAAAERYLAEVTEGMTPAERKKWSLYLPFEEEEDDERPGPAGRSCRPPRR